MTVHKRLYYNTLEALDFVFNNSHGISLADYHNHNMAFDLTSTQEASHDFVHPELTINQLHPSLIHRWRQMLSYFSWQIVYQQFTCFPIEKLLKTLSWTKSEKNE